MKAVIQRVEMAAVRINGILHSTINKGMFILLGVGHGDDDKDIEWLANKVCNLRIFNDENKVMNKNITETQGEILVVSQFTLMASTKKGNRPSYITAARPEIAEQAYFNFCNKINEITGIKVKMGIFGADMKCELINDGPVTIIIDTKKKE